MRLCYEHGNVTEIAFQPVAWDVQEKKIQTAISMMTEKFHMAERISRDNCLNLLGQTDRAGSSRQR